MEQKITFISPRRDRIERQRRLVRIAARIAIMAGAAIFIFWYVQNAPRAWTAERARQDELRIRADAINYLSTHE